MAPPHPRPAPDPHRIALAYAKDASRQTAGMDTIRWMEIGSRLRDLGCQVDLVTDRTGGLDRLGELPVVDSRTAPWDTYDLVKVCYQHSIGLLPPQLPASTTLIARMCRVADAERPERDAARRHELLERQAAIAGRAHYIAVNSTENAERWRALYGTGQQTLVVPTGCPEEIPQPTTDPYGGAPVALFCGSLTASRFVPVLNALARELARTAPEVEVHFLGRDRRHLYGDVTETLDPQLVRVHTPVDAEQAWQYILHARVGLALAPSMDVFESELSKIYYYLRAGLPVVTEHTAMNRGLLEETGHGRWARYDDIAGLAGAVLAALDMPPRCPSVMRYMAQTHSWQRRARVYLDALTGAGGHEASEAS